MFQMTDQERAVSPVAGAYTDLYSAYLEYATQNSEDGDPINNIETCTCPEEYTVSLSLWYPPAYGKIENT